MSGTNRIGTTPSLKPDVAKGKGADKQTGKPLKAGDLGKLIERSHLHLAVEGVEERLVPLRLTVQERIGEPTRVSCTVAVRNTALTLEQFVLKPARIDFLADPQHRIFHGVCVRVQQMTAGEEWLRFQLEIRPAFWRLTQRRTSRIFQNLSPEDVILQVLSEAGIERVDNRIMERLDPFDYIVQYNETDFTFVSRLMETHGYAYFFTHGEEGDVLVLFDTSAELEHMPLHGTIPLLAPGARASRDDPAVWNWTGGVSQVPDRVTATDYDFTRAGLTLETAEPVEEVPAFDDAVFHYPGDYTELGEGSRLGRIRAQAIAAQTMRYSGVVNTSMLSAGHLFDLVSPSGEEKSYLVTAATHTFLATDSDETTSRVNHSCSFEAIDAGVPYRLPMVTPRPIIPGIQTGVVAGPPGEEIHTDEFGRIKVRFRWNLTGETDENASCWIRVATPWAGTGWGQIHVPRIGHEVIVQFEEGNPDRPVVTGMLFNSNTPVPNGLPGTADTMGIRSNTTPGGGGANELMMRDTAGAEVMTQIAERDYELTVKNDAHINVGYEKGDPGSYYFNVHQDRIESVSNGDYNLGVDTGNRNTFVNANDDTTVNGSSSLTVAGNEQVKVGGGRSTKVDGNDGVKVDGNRVEEVGGLHSFKAPDILMNGTSNYGVESPNVSIAGTSLTQIGTATIVITGDSISLEGGGSSIVIDGSGVTITGSVINLNS